MSRRYLLMAMPRIFLLLISAWLISSCDPLSSCSSCLVVKGCKFFVLKDGSGVCMKAGRKDILFSTSLLKGCVAANKIIEAKAVKPIASNTSFNEETKKVTFTLPFVPSVNNRINTPFPFSTTEPKPNLMNSLNELENKARQTVANDVTTMHPTLQPFVARFATYKPVNNRISTSFPFSSTELNPNLMNRLNELENKAGQTVENDVSTMHTTLQPFVAGFTTYKPVNNRISTSFPFSSSEPNPNLMNRLNDLEDKAEQTATNDVTTMQPTLQPFLAGFTTYKPVNNRISTPFTFSSTERIPNLMYKLNDLEDKAGQTATNDVTTMQPTLQPFLAGFTTYKPVNNRISTPFPFSSTEPKLNLMDRMSNLKDKDVESEEKKTTLAAVTINSPVELSTTLRSINWATTIQPIAEESNDAVQSIPHTTVEPNSIETTVHTKYDGYPGTTSVVQSISQTTTVEPNLIEIMVTPNKYDGYPAAATVVIEVDQETVEAWNRKQMNWVLLAHVIVAPFIILPPVFVFIFYITTRFFFTVRFCGRLFGSYKKIHSILPLFYGKKTHL